MAGRWVPTSLTHTWAPCTSRNKTRPHGHMICHLYPPVVLLSAALSCHAICRHIYAVVYVYPLPPHPSC